MIIFGNSCEKTWKIKKENHIFLGDNKESVNYLEKVSGIKSVFMWL